MQSFSENNNREMVKMHFLFLLNFSKATSGVKMFSICKMLKTKYFYM